MNTTPGQQLKNKRMKKIATWIGCLAFCGVQAQVTVTSSEEYTNNTPLAGWTKALGQDETGYYLLREAGSVSQPVLLLEKYSPALKLVYSKNIESTTGVMGNSEMHRLTEMNHGRIVVFVEGWSKAEGKNSFLVKEVREDGTVAEKGILLETEPATGLMKSARYSVSFSPDGSKLLVLTQKPFAKEEKERIRLQVFTTDTYASIWKQDLTLENEADRFPVNDIAVDNAGNAYVFQDIKITMKEHQFRLVTANADQFNTTPLDLRMYHPSAHKMQIDNAGKLLICGMLVVQGTTHSNWQGTWFLLADSKGEILQNKVEPLGADLLRMAGIAEKRAMTENFSLDDYVLKDVILKPSGGAWMITEELRKSSNVVGQVTPPVYEYTFQYGGIMTIAMDGDGNRQWTNWLEKRQEERTLDPNRHYGSFAYQVKDDKLHYVWNFMDLHSDPPLNKYRYWFDKAGSKINIDNVFGKEAFYPTMLTTINGDGTFAYADRTFNALPLEEIQKPNAFLMATDPSYFFPTKNGIVILSRMPGIESKRFKFNTINY
jgi:hypothetical protein